ncbi:unnamed protein product [Durusdinium trenchii]|uniref:Uncharacterized protein n=1 Tax=Durusdinium trenchii TaxID=1381693 RepID=A0ABP0PI27_9DINO
MALRVALLSLPLALAMRSTQHETLATAVSSAKAQMEDIWGRVTDDVMPAPMPSALAPLKLMSAAQDLPLIGPIVHWANVTEDLRTTFSWRKDYPLPPGHQKLIHPVGSVAKIKLEWDHEMINSLGFTGVFTEDQDYALIRIGPAGALKKTGMAPGVSVKVFRDYKESVNTLMLYSLRGQNGFSHFEHTLCNKLSDFRDKSFAENLLLKSFKKASAYPFTTGLSQWAEQDHTSPKFPFVICFRPMDHVRAYFERFKDEPFEHIQEQLQHLSAGKKIYEIYVGAGPRTQLKPVGHVSLVSEFHKTKFGDQKLFFRHDWFEEDLEWMPAWKDWVDAEEFWYEEGANNFYSSIDPSEQKEVGNQNAWVGGYNPSSGSEIVENLKTYLPFLPWSWVSWMQRTEAAGSSASTGAGLHETSGQASAQRHVEASGCPFAYLHQGDSSFIHALLK